MTDKQFEKIKKGLQFHSEGGIDNLCTMTETTLRTLLDKASKTIEVERFEAYGQCRDSRRIAELEAENERLTVSYETLKLHDEEEIGMLKSENAELKENNKMLEQGYIWHDYDAGEDCYEDSHEGKWVKRNEVYQLTKAKKIIKALLRLWNDVMTEETVRALIAEAEQFLKEIEK